MGSLAARFRLRAAWAVGAELSCMALLTILMNYGVMVFGVTDYVAKQRTLHYGAAILGEPRYPGRERYLHPPGAKISRVCFVLRGWG